MVDKLEIVEGVQGLAVYLNDIRITGRSTKPLGGGEVIKSFRVDRKAIAKAIKGPARP